MLFIAREDYSGGSDLAEARQEDLSATREHAHARSLAETDDPAGELQRGGDRSDGEERVEIRSDQAKGGGVTADETGATNENKSKLQMDGQALVDGVGAGEVREVQTDGTGLVGGIGTGGVGGKAASVGGKGDAIRAAEVEPQTGGTERVDGILAGEEDGEAAGVGGTGDGIGAGEVGGKAAGVGDTGDGIGTGDVPGKAAGVGGTGDGTGAGEVGGKIAGVAGTGDGIRAGESELQLDGTVRLNGTGTGEVDGNAASVEGTGAWEFPVIDVELEAIRAEAIAKAAARAVRDAVEINRKTDLARARNAEKARRREEKKEKLGRKGSRDARRRKKLQDRESREKRKTGERLGPPVEGMEEPARLEREAVAGEGAGMLAQGDVRGGVHAAAAPAGTETRADEVNGRRVTADESSATGAKKQKLQTDGHAALDDLGAGEAQELERDGMEVLDGMGAGGADHREAGNDGSGSGSGGFPFVDIKQEELRAKAVAEGAERVARDAVEANRKADLARARHAEKDRRRARRQEKVERKASRDARRDERRLMKLQDRESRMLSQREAATGTVSSEGSRSVGNAGR